MSKTPLHLTPEQAAIADSMQKAGHVVLGRITREQFDGTNAETCGGFVLELGTVKEAAVPLMRAAILEANNPAKPKRKYAKNAA